MGWGISQRIKRLWLLPRIRSPRIDHNIWGYIAFRCWTFQVHFIS